MSDLASMAMQHAIISLDIPPEKKGDLLQLYARKMTIHESEWSAEQLRTQMHHQFGVYETEQAIRQAQETLSMIIPKGDP